MTSSNAAATESGHAIPSSAASPSTTTTPTNTTITTSTIPNPNPQPHPAPPQVAAAIMDTDPNLNTTPNAEANLDTKPEPDVVEVEADPNPNPNSNETLADRHRDDQNHVLEPEREDRQDHYMLSPPTVSPLSTPAVTAAQSMNGDNALDDDDLPKLDADEHPGPASISNAAANSVALPKISTKSRSRSASMATSLQRAQLQSRGQGYAAVATTDDDDEYNSFSPHQMNVGRMSRHPSVTDLDPSAFLISLAQASSAQLARDLPMPTAVAPSEISLQASFTQGSDIVSGSLDQTSASASQKLESFARIEFADSVFQMTTYAVIIGRDQKAMEQARKDERREERYRLQAEHNEKMGLPPPTPFGRDKGKFSKSYVSEEGGMLGPESDEEDTKMSTRKRRQPSSGTPSQHGDPKVKDEQEEAAKSNLQYVSHTEGVAAVDLGTLQPALSHVPFVGIHSPGPDIASKTKVISRKHLKIQFNEKRGVFEGISLHRNGFFCEDRHYNLDSQPVTIRSGDRLQIKDVEFTFVINGVEKGKTGAEELREEDETSSKRCSIGGKEMSFDFEHSDHENFPDTSDSSRLSDAGNVTSPALKSEDGGEEGNEAAESQSEGEDPDNDGDDDVDGEGDVMMLSAESADARQGFVMPEIPRRRGPGRPPKDGIMSKRERRLLKKQMEEFSKKTLPQEPAGEKIKRPVGRPRKNPAPEEGEKPEKRKYNKRKREDGEEGSDGEKRAKEKKDKKVRLKSPPLELTREDYTEEQLQKPSKNYGVLIDEALTNGPSEGLTLKQIYKRIMAAYPWFYFHAETKGWESSVRHNLIGNEAFNKDEQSGRWQRVPGVELDAGKKRKAPSPDRHMGPLPPHQMGQQPYSHGGNYMQQGGLNFAQGSSYTANNNNNQSHTAYQQTSASQPPQAYNATQNQQAGQQQQQQQQQPSQQQQQQQQQPYAAQTQAPATTGSSLLARQPTGPQQSTYSSPYARPPPIVNAPVKSENSTLNLQAVPTAPVPHRIPHVAPQSQPAAGPPSVPASTSRRVLNQEEEQSITMFKNNMIAVLSKSSDKATQIVETAVNRALGRPAQPTLVGFEVVENTLIEAVHKLLKDMQDKRNAPKASPAPISKQPTPAPRQSPVPAVPMDVEIQKRVKKFRDSMVTALKSKTELAEAVVDSAINRALGLKNPGAFKGWEQADRLMFENVLKMIAEVRKDYGLPAQPAASVGRSAQSSQLPQQGQPRQGPSASPAPGQPSTPVSATGAGIAPQITDSTPVSASATPQPAGVSATTSGATKPTIPRPGLSIARPSSIGIARPGAVSVARPPMVRQNSAATTPIQATTAQTAASVPTTSPAPTPVLVPTSINTNGRTNPPTELPAAKTASPASLPTATPASIAKTVSPAPPPTTKPSAGAIEQIMGQKRVLDNAHAPTTEATTQSEPKRQAISPP